MKVAFITIGTRSGIFFSSTASRYRSTPAL